MQALFLVFVILISKRNVHDDENDIILRVWFKIYFPAPNDMILDYAKKSRLRESWQLFSMGRDWQAEPKCEFKDFQDTRRTYDCGKNSSPYQSKSACHMQGNVNDTQMQFMVRKRCVLRINFNRSGMKYNIGW